MTLRETLVMQLDGAAVVPAMAALAHHGVLARLRARTASIDDLATATGARPGPLAVALRVLALQGWLHDEPRRVRVTAAGRPAVALADVYARAHALVPSLRAVETMLDGGDQGRVAAIRDALHDGWAGDPRVAAHCDGAVLGPFLYAMARSGRTLDVLPPRWTRHAAALLGAGRAWRYPVAYLELLRAAPALLAGAEPPPVDRALSIGVSGEVFTQLVGPAFQRLLAKVFDGPRALVDVGSGDGTMLRDLWRAAAARTTPPPLAVGVEVDPLARAATERTLAAAGIPHVVVDGDVDAPEALARRLASAGIDLAGAVCVSKSVIHDREWRPPADAEAVRRRVPRTRAVAVGPDGERIAPAALEQNLVEHFARWRAAVPRFGMVVADAHCVSPAVAARHVGRTLVTLLEATHGWSRQYLVEADVFRRAAVEAGFAVRGRERLGAAALGHDYLSVLRLAPR